MISIFQQSVWNNSTSFDGLQDTVLASCFDRARLIGIGEVPHHVQVYYDIVEDVLERALSQGNAVLLLLEREFWFARFLESFLEGQTEEWVSLTTDNPEDGKTYGKRFMGFCDTLRRLAHCYPAKLRCSGIDLFLHGFLEKKTAFVRSISPEKFAQSQVILGHYHAEECDRFALEREQFLFDEAVRAIEQHAPDKIILFAGSSHCSKADGAPFGKTAITPLFARLMNVAGGTACNAQLFPLHGTFGTMKKNDGQLTLASARCDDLFKEGPKRAIRDALRTFEGSRFLTRLSELEIGEESSPEYQEIKEGYEFLVSFAQVTADE